MYMYNTNILLNDGEERYMYIYVRICMYVLCKDEKGGVLGMYQVVLEQGQHSGPDVHGVCT